MRKFIMSIAVLGFYCSGPTIAQRLISADFTRIEGKLNTMFNECVGAGRANEGLRADWQQQLAYVRKECGFKYIRMHGLLSDDMGVYQEDKNGKPAYNFMYIDVLFDFLHSIGMKPFVELGFMPSLLASSGKTIFWWRGNVTPPRDYEKWGALVRSLVQHFTERYGADEVKSWVENVPAGIYALELYKVGYKCNDAYSTYLSLGRPPQLSSRQVEAIKNLNNGAPIEKEIVEIKNGVPFAKDWEIRENDVFLLNLIKL